MTREEQDTDRALMHAEQEWLLARGWRATLPGRAGSLVRYAHPAAPTARETYTARDALAMTRADPLRFKARRHTAAGPA